MATVFLSFLTSTVPKGVPERHSPGSLAGIKRVRFPRRHGHGGQYKLPESNEVGRARRIGLRFREHDHRVRGKGPLHRPPGRTPGLRGGGLQAKQQRLHRTSSASWKRETRLPALHSPPLGRRARSPPPRGNEWAPAHRACTHRRRRRAARWPAAASSSCG